MKRARGVLVFVLVIVLLLSIPGATVFAQETVNDLAVRSGNTRCSNSTIGFQ